MTQYAMVVDLNRCVGCHACALACRAEWQVPAKKGYRRNWLKRMGPTETPHGMSYTFYPGLCNHCDKPACTVVCPADPVEKTFKDPKTGKTKTMMVPATWKDPFNGTVQIDKKRCLGCGACAEACPYGARYVNYTLPEPKADKCTFCVERLAHGLQPACVQTCIGTARIFGDIDDPNSEVSKYVKQGAIRMESTAVRTGPNVRYFGKKKDIYLLTSTYTPRKMPEVSLFDRRKALAQLMKPAMKKAKDLGLLGLAGAVFVKGLEEKKEEE